MYKVLLDGEIIHDSMLDVALNTGQVQLTDNITGSFKFAIEKGNPGYEKVSLLTSMIQVLFNGKEIFCGRPFAIRKEMNGAKTVECEGELAYLLDTIQRPSENHDITVRGFLEMLLNNHNEQVEENKRFYIGNVTVTDSNDSLYRYTNWENTLNCIIDKLVNRLGGHLVVRKENGKRYLDYLAEYGRVNEQVIEFGENLLDYAEDETCDSIASCIIPLGARQEKEDSDPQALEKYLTIENVNDGKDYVFSQSAVEHIGWVSKTVKFDDVTLPENLKRKAEEYLNVTQYADLTLSINAIDLSLIKADIRPIEMGDNIRVLSKPHGIDRYFTVLQRSYNILDPSQDTIILGNTIPKSAERSIVDGDKANSDLIKDNMDASLAYIEAVKLFSALAASTVGCYETTITQDGATVRYWHDRPELSQSKYIRLSNSEGFFISSDSGETWKGIDKNANALLETLTAKSIVADKIKGGTIEGVTGIFEQGKIGGWALSENKLKTVVTDELGNSYIAGINSKILRYVPSINAYITQPVFYAGSEKNGMEDAEVKIYANGTMNLKALNMFESDGFYVNTTVKAENQGVGLMLTKPSGRQVWVCPEWIQISDGDDSVQITAKGIYRNGVQII